MSSESSGDEVGEQKKCGVCGASLGTEEGYCGACGADLRKSAANSAPTHDSNGDAALPAMGSSDDADAHAADQETIAPAQVAAPKKHRGLIVLGLVGAIALILVAISAGVGRNSTGGIDGNSAVVGETAGFASEDIDLGAGGDEDPPTSATCSNEELGDLFDTFVDRVNSLQSAELAFADQVITNETYIRRSKVRLKRLGDSNRELRRACLPPSREQVALLRDGNRLVKAAASYTTYTTRLVETGAGTEARYQELLMAYNAAVDRAQASWAAFALDNNIRLNEPEPIDEANAVD